MDLTVFLAVLLAAACHAGWNALLKLDVEPIIAASLMAAACAVVVAPFVVASGLPARAAWPYLAGSVAIHALYYVTLSQAYRTGDLGQVYPIARGSAPLMTASLAAVVLGENLSGGAWLGVALLACGIVLLALRGGRDRARIDRWSVGFALLTSLTITAYTLVDGLGARVSGAPVLYTAWLFLLSGAVMAVFGLGVRGGLLVAAVRTKWTLAVAGAALSVAAYAIAIWAMTVAPIALVAALRETSVLFAALIGLVFLREPVMPVRIMAAGIVLAGVLLLRLS